MFKRSLVDEMRLPQRRSFEKLFKGLGVSSVWISLREKTAPERRGATLAMLSPSESVSTKITIRCWPKYTTAIADSVRPGRRCEPTCLAQRQGDVTKNKSSRTWKQTPRHPTASGVPRCRTLSNHRAQAPNRPATRSRRKKKITTCREIRNHAIGNPELLKCIVDTC